MPYARASRLTDHGRPLSWAPSARGPEEIPEQLSSADIEATTGNTYQNKSQREAPTSFDRW
jgi:hypothetical protein